MSFLRIYKNLMSYCSSQIIEFEILMAPHFREKFDPYLQQAVFSTSRNYLLLSRVVEISVT